MIPSRPDKLSAQLPVSTPDQAPGQVAAQALGHPHVHILLCTWNGADFLQAQLQSFLDQSHANWSLWVRDDGSTDRTLDILTGFQTAHQDRVVRIVSGAGHKPGHKPGQTPAQDQAQPSARGSAANFLSLLAHPDLPPGHAAFADQDDVWLPHKLERGLTELTRTRPNRPETNISATEDPPAVYASRTIETDARLRPLRQSTLHPRPPAFRNALVQNVLGGNTILMNPAALRLLRATCEAALAGPGVPFHDWWVYLVMTGAGGDVLNDPEPGLLYRQHGGNVLGASRGMRSGAARLSMVGQGQYKGWLDRNLTALEQVSDYLTPSHQRLVADFVALRRSKGISARMAGLKHLGIHRQTRAGDLLLQGLALTGQL